MSKNIFNSVQYPKVGSNTFDLSHDVKMSFRMGPLYPTLVMDVLPGDKIRLSTETMLRFAPLISPVMHRINVTTHYFFVPNRLLWSNWEKWITGELDVEPPYCKLDEPTPYTTGSIADYMGIPTENGNVGMTKINALPLAAYRLIWCEYYRDQNLYPDNLYAPFNVVNGNNDSFVTLYNSKPYNRAWMHDYFTASLPFAQKGDAVSLPLFTGDTDIPIYANPLAAPGQIVRNNSTGNPISSTLPLVAGSDGYLKVDSSPDLPVYIDPNGSMVARLEDVQAESADINTLRRAFRLQEWLERNARGGTRYIENIMAHFGVKSSDARLNRPEFLGGSYQKMVISEVLSTAETEVPVGQMAGHGISVGGGKSFTYRAEEHGFIIGLINVQPVTAYQQGINKMFSREDRFDYFWPSFAHIGEQEVKNKEVFVGDQTYNEDTFGYVPRYAEYRYMSSRVSGEFRTSLAHWHLGRIFETPPSLNRDFVASNPSTRIFAVEGDNDHIYGHIFNNVKAVRKIPKFGTPSF